MGGGDLLLPPRVHNISYELQSKRGWRRAAQGREEWNSGTPGDTPGCPQTLASQGKAERPVPYGFSLLPGIPVSLAMLPFGISNLYLHLPQSSSRPIPTPIFHFLSRPG